MLRKMVFGPRGRLSTDLDFTRRTELDLDDLMLMLLDALGESYHGIEFRFDRNRDWYLTDDGCAAKQVEDIRRQLDGLYRQFIYL